MAQRELEARLMPNGHAKSISLRVKGTGAPDEAQLGLIRNFTLADMAAEQLYVRSFVLAHNGIDRDNECFSDAILSDFARTLPGKGLHIRHPSGWDGDSGPGEGRFFAAELVRMSHDEARKELREPGLAFPPDAREAVLLMASAYAVRTPDNASLLMKVDGGVAGDISIGFTAKGGVERLVDAEGRELNSYRWKGPGEALEGSLVWLGAQPGARAVKNAPLENNMQFKDLYEAEQAKVVTLQKALDDAKAEVVTAKAAGGIPEAIRKALGDNAALLETPDVLAETVTAGKAYKAAQVDELVRCERALGLIGDTAEDTATAKAAAEALPLSKIDAMVKHYTPRLPASGSKLAPSDPNKKPDAEGKVPAALDSAAIAG